MKPWTLTVPALALLLTACGGATGGAGVNPRVSGTGMRPATNDQRGAAAHRPAPLHAGELVGRDRAALIGQFGPPRLDATEGPATRLQFSSAACVLDAYLYPPRDGATPVVTHIDTRTPGGDDVERAACVAALRRR